MYYAITESKIFCEKNLERLNKKMSAQLEQQEFKILGNDYIIKLDNYDLDFVQDKRRLSLIPIHNLFSRKEKPNYLLYLVVLLNIVILFQSCSATMNSNSDDSKESVRIERSNL